MVTNTRTQQGWIDYDTVQKLKQMDPGRAEAYKKMKWEEYQKNRVSDAVAQYQQEYADNVMQDPDNSPHFAQVLRERIVAIPMIDQFPEFADLYEKAKNQITVLATKEKQIKNIEKDILADQPGMADL